MKIMTTLSVTDDHGQPLFPATGRSKHIPTDTAQALLVEADTLQAELLLTAVAILHGHAHASR
jgi:hypothetical protein